VLVALLVLVVLLPHLVSVVMVDIPKSAASILSAAVVVQQVTLYRLYLVALVDAVEAGRLVVLAVLL
jgi:hypothetical protein